MLTRIFTYLRNRFTRNPAVHIMLDIETLGTTPGSIVLSIGATVFDQDGPSEFDWFYGVLETESQRAFGLTSDAETVKWWNQQSDLVKDETFGRGTTAARPTAQVLDDFAIWLRSQSERGVTVWANGASFDFAILAAVYRAYGRKVPWKFFTERCYRTLKSLFPQVPRVANPMAHDALADAEAQAAHAAKILNRYVPNAWKDR